MSLMKQFLAALGICIATGVPASTAVFYKPYAEAHVNYLYNLLFCDNLDLFKSDKSVESNGLWRTLLAEPPDLKALQRIAENESNEGRVRAIAFNRLRAAGQKVAKKKILGVIVEVPQPQGLDVLAAFREGGARYLNQSGGVAIFEGRGNPAETLAKQLVVVSQPAVDLLGPWDKDRLPPPKTGMVRITFLVSDGLYFGEGPATVMQTDPMGGPVLTKATQLLLLCVEKVRAK